MASQARFLLTEDLKANLRFAENFARHKTYLLEIDRKRFRGLGEAHTQGFVRHAIGLADHLRFPYIEDTQYIMFVMTFLGSYFYEDPRYKPLADTLALARAETSNRIDALHQEFVRFSNTYLSDDLSIYRAALTTFFEGLDNVNQADLQFAQVLDLFFHAYRNADLARDQFPVDAMTAHAREGARFLSIETPSGTALCLALALWMGSGFYKDYLYPWSRDCLANTQANSLPREMALRNYAIKRLRRQLAALKSV